jgi:pimeloyl-ACP methyl ester carboxylesterase
MARRACAGRRRKRRLLRLDGYAARVSKVEIIGPTSSLYLSQRLRLHYVDWGNEGAPPLLLIHGGKDHARNWDWVAREMRDEYRVIAPDLRGHGDSAWAVGGMYTIADFVLDVTQLVEALSLRDLTVVGHSLGGAVALHFAGIHPERVRRLVAIEGLGPPPAMEDRLSATPGWQRLRSWVESMQELARRTPRRYASIDEAAERMLDANSFLSPEQAHHLTVHGVARNEDGTFSWKFDNYVRGFGPTRFGFDEVRELWGRIECPVLLVRGTESWASDPARDGRIDAFRDARLANIDGAGHWVHHDRLDEFLRLLREFLTR